MNCGLKALENICSIKKVSAFSLISLSRDNGLDLKIFRVALKDLVLVHRPAIFHSDNHFEIVLEGSPIPNLPWTGYVLTQKSIGHTISFRDAKSIYGEIVAVKDSVTTVRPAIYDDMHQIKDLVIDFHKESLSEFGLGVGIVKIYETTRMFIDNHILLVAEKEGEVIGLIGGAVVPSSFNSSDVIGQEFMWYLRKDSRIGSVGIRLLKAFEKACVIRGATKMIMIHMNNLNPNEMALLYKRNGYSLMEKHYIKEV